MHYTAYTPASQVKPTTQVNSKPIKIELTIRSCDVPVDVKIDLDFQIIIFVFIMILLGSLAERRTPKSVSTQPLSPSGHK